MVHQPDPEKIRKQLIEQCSDEELRRRCYDSPDFQAVYRHLEATTTKVDLINALVAHAEQAAMLDQLAAWRPSRRTKRWALRLLVLVIGLALVGISWARLVWLARPVRPDIPLTCQPLPRPVRVGIAQLPGCQADMQTLTTAWRQNDTEIVFLPETFTSSGEARNRLSRSLIATVESASQTDFDIVMWGRCQAETATLTYELTSLGKPTEIYQPTSLNLTGPITDMMKLAPALINYQAGRHQEAISQFVAASSTPTSPEQALLQANNLLFARQYQAAGQAFETILATVKPAWSAASNNLGVTYFNQEAEKDPNVNQAGLLQFERAMDQAALPQENEIFLLAAGNYSNVRLQVKSWDEAEASCRASQDIDSQSALPHLCLANYYLYRYFDRINTGKPSQSELNVQLNYIDDSLVEAENFSDPPAVVHVYRGFWHEAHQQPDLEVKAAD